MLPSFLIAIVDHLEAVFDVLLVQALVFSAEAALVLVDSSFVLTDFDGRLFVVLLFLFFPAISSALVFVLTRKFNAEIVLDVLSSSLLVLSSASDFGLAEESGPLSRLVFLLLFLELPSSDG